MAQEHLDNALLNFSGYIAVDELYDGNLCLLSLVDNRQHRRLIFQVLDRSPKKEDIIFFLNTFKTELDKRGLVLKGITTDGSPLYTEAIAQVFGSVPHQLCIFHVLKEINKAVIKAIAEVRRELRRQIPQTKRGRPSSADRASSRKKRRIEAKIGALFEHRCLFVQRHLTGTQRAVLAGLIRGNTHLRTLREIVEEVYRLFDRRCRMATALTKLAKLRCCIARFKTLAKAVKKLFAPSLEKALLFLDEKLLPATSNSVERTNRRYRKMQRSVYRIRSQKRVCQRVALDILREDSLPTRKVVLAWLRDQRQSQRRHHTQPLSSMRHPRWPSIKQALPGLLPKAA